MDKNFEKAGDEFVSEDYSNFGNSPERTTSTERKMHKAKCSGCGNDCQVPFKPKEGRPVYCRECYSKQKSR